MNNDLKLALAIASIQKAIRDYHYALDTRQHGGVAQDKALDSICRILDMHWIQGEEKKRREENDQRNS